MDCRGKGKNRSDDVILGIRVSNEEFNIIKEGLTKLKNKCKTNKKIINILHAGKNRYS